MSKKKPYVPQVTTPSRISEGLPFPLGATWDGLGVNFAIFSAHATKVELCLFDSSGEIELERIELPEYTDEIWHGYLPDAHPGQIYGILYKDKVESGAGFLERLGNPYTQVALDPEGRGGLDFGLTAMMFTI